MMQQPMHDRVVCWNLPTDSVIESSEERASLVLDHLHSSLDRTVAAALTRMGMLWDSGISGHRHGRIVRFEQAILLDIPGKIVAFKRNSVAPGFADGIFKEANDRMLLI